LRALINAMQGILDRGRFCSLSSFIIYVGVYVGTIYWFAQVDYYHRYFDRAGILVVAENAFRVAFIFYLFWIVHAAGSILLRLISAKDLSRIDALDRLALCFFAGTGVWHVTMLGLGFMNLYTVPVAIIITLPLVVLSYWNLRTTAQQLGPPIVTQARLLWTSTLREKARAAPKIALVIAAFGAAGTLLLVKGLYPSGGHDYFTHYFYYLQSVIDEQGLWPNDVWYHYFYSKGAGLYFLAMLLTDPLAPQLVTYCFVMAAALALFQLLRRIAPHTLWPFVGIILFLGLYIYTPGLGLYRAHGGWGEFEKLHELTAALVIAILWMVSGVLERRGHIAMTWASAAASAIVAAIVIDVTIGVYLGAVFALLAVLHLVIRRLTGAVICLAFATVAGATVIAIFLINYATTGLASDQAILVFWPLANLEKMYQIGELPEMILMHWGYTGLRANRLPLSLNVLVFYLISLRLYLLLPLFGTGAVAALAAIMLGRAQFRARTPMYVLAVALLVFSAICIVEGRAQTISFFRYSSFVFPIVIAAGVALWTIPRGAWRYATLSPPYYALAPLAALAACLMAASIVYPIGRFSAALTNACRFAVGRYSFDTAYTTQSPWPGRLPWGGIYPGARGAYQTVGPHVRIRSMHIHSYCMLPDCRIETYPAFLLSPNWDRLMFGSPEDGRAALQSAGINYFLFSRELAKNLTLADALPLSPLFAPDNIGRYLGIRWTDGTTALLTWLGPNTVPLDEGWLTDYRRAVENSPTIRSFPYAAMKSIYERLRATPHPWTSFKLPWG